MARAVQGCGRQKHRPGRQRHPWHLSAGWLPTLGPWDAPPPPLPPLPLPLKHARSGSVCGVARLSHGAHGSCCGQKAWDRAGVAGSQVRIRKRPVSPRALATPLSGRLALMVSFPRQDWVQAPALSPLGARACGKFCVAYVSPCSSPDQFPVQRMSLGGPRGAPAPGGASR